MESRSVNEKWIGRCKSSVAREQNGIKAPSGVELTAEDYCGVHTP